MGRRTYLYALGRPGFDRFTSGYARAPRPHLARRYALDIFDAGRHPRSLVWPLDPARLHGLPERWAADVQRASGAACMGAHAAHVPAALERAVAGVAPVAPTVSASGAGARFVPPPDVAGVARALATGGPALPAVRAELGAVRARIDEKLRPPSFFDPSNPVWPEADAALRAAKRLNALDVLQLVLALRFSRNLREAAEKAWALIERVEASRGEPPPPIPPGKHVGLQAAEGFVAQALAAVDAWEAAEGERRLRALRRFYAAAARAGRYVVVERA